MDFDLTEEQRDFRDATRNWVRTHYPKEKVRELEADEGHFPVELWDELAKAGLHGIGIAEEYGGQGGDSITQAILARELTRQLGGLSGVWGISSFAGGKTLSLYGTDVQKGRFLPALADGTIRFSIAITEPGGGTDLLGGMRTTARRTRGGWVLDGHKVWSSGAHASDYLVVLAKDGVTDTGRPAVTTFLVPTATTGVEIRKIPKLGMRCLSSCEIYLDSVEVPDELVVGEPGRGFHQLLPTLNNERIITASSALGIIDAVLEDGLAYLSVREAFGRPIGQFQALQHKIADITAWQHQSELLVYRAAWLQSLGRPCGVEATLAHSVSAEYASQAADIGIQLLGGLGYAMETHMQRYWRDSRLYRIAPITTEMAKNMIAESHGLPRSF
jgi:acyl-CoA dehydrogenase